MSKREKRPAPSFSNFGFSTILLAFVMICIVTISALSLLTANSDYKLSQKVAQKNSEYYLAEETAYAKLSEIDKLLAKAYSSSISKSSYYTAVEQALGTLDYGDYETNISGAEMSGAGASTRNGRFTYIVPISENQNLRIVLLITYPESDQDTFFVIESWQSEYEIQVPEDEYLDLIG